ncbi:MAG: hypothetical protein ABI347_02735 [Nitrososphaera sp.]
MGIKDPELLLKSQIAAADKEAIAREIEDNLARFIQHHKAEKASAYLIGLRLAAVKKFYKKNRMSKLIDWEYIEKTSLRLKGELAIIPAGMITKSKIYKKMRKIADEREAAVLMLYWSAGMRSTVRPDSQ